MSTSNSPLDPRTRWLVGLILVVAALLRLTYLLEAVEAPDFHHPRFESQYHDYWARALVSGDWTPPPGVTDPEIPERPFFRPPGYPYALAAVRGVSTGSVLPRLVQMGLGLATCWLLFGLGRRRFGDAAGLTAAAMMGTYWVSLYFEAEFMAPSLLLFLLTLWTSQIERCGRLLDEQRLTWKQTALAGFLLGLTALVRPNVLVLGAPPLIWWLWLSRRTPGGRTLPWRPAVGFVVAIGLTVLPATLRNGLVTDDWVLVTSNAGINLFVGNHPDSDGYTPGSPDLAALLGETGWDSFDQPNIAAAVAAEVGRPLKDSEVSSYFSRRAWRTLRAEPAAVAKLWGRKLLLFFGPAEISNTKVLTMEHRHSPTLGLGLDFATVWALALWGSLLLAWNRLRAKPQNLPFGGFLWLCLAFFTASYLPFFVSARFRLPMVPWLMLLAGGGVAMLWSAWKERRWPVVGAALVVAAALRLFTGVAWIPYEPDEALWHARRGLLYQQAEKTDRAIGAFEQALEMDPDRVTVLLPLADSLVRAERMDDAIAVYRRALQLDPSSIAGHNNLAMALARRGQVQEAVEHWRAVLHLDPRRLSALVNLAGTLITSTDPAVRRPQEALELAQRASQLTAGTDPRVGALLQAAQQAVAETQGSESAPKSQ